MKKQLLTIFSAVLATSAIAQITSPAWQTLQNTNYTMTSASSKFLDVVSSNVVWSVGYSGTGVSANYNDFSRTINAGTTFNTGNIYADTNTYVIANLEGIDANTAWVSSYLKVPQAQGAIHKTTNGGATWVNMTAANMYTNAVSFTDIVAFTTSSVGITMGDPHAGNANEFEIWRTADAGATWTLVPGANIPNPTAGEFGLVNIYAKQGTANYWFGTNKGRIFRSTDAGLTWNVAVLPGTPTASLNVNNIAFTTSLTGVSYVYNSSTMPSTFEEYVTNNGGVSWTKVTTIDPVLGRNDICAIPGTNIFASCANTSTANISNLSYSKDGGLTWTDWGSINIAYLKIDFADACSGWASTFETAGNLGGIYKFNGPTAIFSLASNNVCLSGPSATVVPVNSSLGCGSYTWSSGAGVAFSSPTATNPTITFTANGTYTISLLSNNGFTTNATSQVVNVIGCVSPVASFNSPTGTLCNKAVLNFTNTSNGSPAPTYSWSTSAASATINPSSTATNVSITFSTAGVYSVTLLATNGNGTSQVTQTVNISNCAPVVGFLLPASATNCSLSPITTTNTSTSANGALSYTWSIMPLAGGMFSPNAGAQNPQINFTAAGNYTITLSAINASGISSAVNTISVSACVGIAENSLLASNVKLYPNPTKDLVTVSLPHNGNEYTITVTDILGTIVYTQKTIKNDTQINLANKAKGIYFITIEGNKEKATKKIIVE